MTIGFIQAKSDPSLFTQSRSHSFIAILVYVDDLIVTSNNMDSIQLLKQFLDDTFKIKDLGCLKYFLGIKACRTSEGLNLCQIKYTLDILKEAGLSSYCKPVATPIVLGQKLIHGDGQPLTNVGMYRMLVGRLLYLIDAPTDKYLVAVHRVLRYLKKDPRKGIWYSIDSSLQLQAFTNADWAACAEARKSITGFCIFLGEY